MQDFISKITWILTYFIVRFTIRVIWPVKIAVNKQLAKINGPVIIISNHKSFLDTWIISGSIPFKTFLKILPIRILGGKEYNGLFLKIMEKLGIIPLIYYIYGVIAIKREWSFEEKTQPLVDAAKHHQSVFIFPEGKLNKQEGLGLFKRGAPYVYAHSGAPILPCSINYNHQTHCTVHIGNPTIIPEKILKPEDHDGSFYQKSCNYLKEKVRRLYRVI